MWCNQRQSGRFMIHNNERASLFWPTKKLQSSARVSEDTPQVSSASGGSTKKMVQLDQNRFRPVSMVRSESDTFSSLLSECGQAPFGAAVQKQDGVKWNSAWWLTYPLKNDGVKVSLDDEIPNLWKNNPHVPNHQPELNSLNSLAPDSLTVIFWKSWGQKPQSLQGLSRIDIPLGARVQDLSVQLPACHDVGGTGPVGLWAGAGVHPTQWIAIVFRQKMSWECHRFAMPHGFLNTVFFW